MAIYIREPFAISGDKTTIPVAPPPGGEVSYESGFGVNYQLDPDTDPDALDVPRLQFNQLMFDITSSIQQYQQLGFPDFITTSDNGGSPFSYSKNAFVRYDDGSGFEIYYSLQDANTALPTDTTKWAKVTFSAGEIPGAAKMYVGATLPSGYVWANGTTIGSAASGATGRANADTSTLYSLLWDAYPNSTLPIQDSSGVATTRGANAAADFAANKRLPTPDWRDTALMGKSDMGGTAARGLVTLAVAGFSPTTLGATGGIQAVQLTGNQNGAHIHTATAANAGTHFHAGTTNIDGTHTHAIEGTNFTGGGSSYTDYTTGNPNGFGTGYVGFKLDSVAAGGIGNQTGGDRIPLRAKSSGSTHAHSFNTNTSGDHTHGITINSSGLGEAHTNMQPTTVVNYIIKLQAIMDKYFRFPFAVTGDRSAVDNVSVDGEVAYDTGYGEEYSLPRLSDPDARNIEREKQNQLFYDITRAIQEYQQFGVPDFITSAQNGGTPFSYSQDAMVRYDDGSTTEVYVSRINSNTDLPTDTASWRKLSVIDLATDITGVLPPENGGMGVDNGSNTLTLEGVVEFTGGFDISFFATGTTSLTLPESGTLATIDGDLPFVTVTTPSVIAEDSSGLFLKNSTGTDVLTIGSANTTNATFAGAVNMGSIGTLTTPLSVANGGTGSSSLTSGSLIIGAGTSAPTGLAPGTAGNMVMNIGGAWVSNAPVVARYSTNAGKSIANITDTVIDYEDVVFDNYSAVTTGAGWVFTNPRDYTAYYQVHAQAILSTGGGWAAGEILRMEIRVNGVVQQFTVWTSQSTNTTGWYIECNGLVAVPDNGTIDVRIYQNSGGAITLLNNSNWNNISIAEIR